MRENTRKFEELNNLVNRKRDSSFTKLSLQHKSLIAKGEMRPRWPIDSTWHWPETDEWTRLDRFSIRNGKKPKRTERGPMHTVRVGKRISTKKKNVKGIVRNRCSDSPWKPWTLIARWRSRCKSAFLATVMIAGVVSASTSASQTVLRRTPQLREKQSITSRLRDYAHRISFFFFLSLSFTCSSQILRRGQRNSVRNYCRWNSISVRVYPRNAILIAYASEKMRGYAFPIAI